MKKTADLIKRYQVSNGKKFRLKDFNPGETGEFASKEEAIGLLEQGKERLTDLQERLYANDHWAVLLIFQAMDAAGKDSTIKHVMSGVNPQGCEVHSFKAPSEEELDHDYLWRCNKRLPERGKIGIFNRSYYEEVLVVRVHPDILQRERIPAPFLGKNIWNDRYQDINAYERYLSRNGVLIRKFFLNVSNEEQRKRFLKRLDEPEKTWKFSAQDVHERENWDEYMRAYEDAIRATSTESAPWFVVPADHKWFTRLVVASVVIDALEGLKLKYPKVDPKQMKELAAVRTMLEEPDKR